MKPIADLNFNKTTHYYYGYYTGMGYFRYGNLENGDLYPSKPNKEVANPTDN